MKRELMQQAIHDLKRGERVSLSPQEKMELFTLALRATDPKMVMVRKERLRGLFRSAYCKGYDFAADGCVPAFDGSEAKKVIDRLSADAQEQQEMEERE